MVKNQFLKNKNSRRQAPKLYVGLSGGLGNQMFQYAFARSLSLRYKLELVQDTWNGFHRDYQYRRKYELDAFNVEKRLANHIERLPLLLYRFHRRISKNSNNIKISFWYGDFFNENRKVAVNLTEECFIYRNTWILGYWQSSKYFSNYAQEITSELMPPPSKIELYKKINDLIIKTESVALGIRMYEESSSPEAHCRSGLVKSAASIRAALNRMLLVRPNARIFVFCTHQSSLLRDLSLPVNTVFVTADLGYDRSADTLWLLSNCRHHIFTNSTYYWWGAWLSGNRYSSQEKTVMAADNFVDISCVPQGWELF